MPIAGPPVGHSHASHAMNPRAIHRARILPLLVICGFAPSALPGQTNSSDSPTALASRRQSFWVSGGIGVGTGGLAESRADWRGLAGIASAWYSNNNLVVGARAADASGWFGPDVHDTALLLGVRNLAPRGLALIAAGPARLGGWHSNGEQSGTRTVLPTEIGIAVSAEAAFTSQHFGIGTDLFVARGGSTSIVGATVSLQVGWFGS